jgi:hypothetical protein
MLFWAFVVWLQFHYTTEAYKVQDPASNVGVLLLLYSLVAVSIGKGRYRFFVGTACVLAMIPWIPVGVLIATDRATRFLRSRARISGVCWIPSLR